MSAKRKTVVGFLVLCAMLVIGGVWFSRVPPSPRYQGEPLSKWLRNQGENSHSDEEAKKALGVLNAKAIPWLIWAVRHGRLPDPVKNTSAPTIWDSIRRQLGLEAGSDYYNERKRAMWALCLLETDSTEVTRIMRDLVGDSEFGVQAAVYLAGKGAEQQAFLIRTCVEGEEIARIHALRSIVEMPSSFDESDWNAAYQKTLPTIFRAMQDSAAAVRAEAAVAYAKAAHLSRLNDLHAEAVPLLIDLLADPAIEVREAASWALLKRGPAASAAVPKAIELLSDPELSVRIRIAKALGLIDREQASKAALLAIADGAEPMALRTTAAEALGRFGVRSHLVDELAASLGSQDHAVKMEAVQSLLEIGPMAAETAPRILEAYEQYSGTDSILEFDRFGIEVAILYWTQALSHRNPTVRERAARALGAQNQIQDNAAVVTALTQAAMDPEKSVRTAATWALQRIQEDR